MPLDDEPLYVQAWNAMLMARMNVIYYQRLADRYETIDRWLRVGSAVISSAGVGAAIKLCGPTAGTITGVVSAVAGAVTLIWQYPARARFAATLVPQYMRHYYALQKLYRRGNELPEKDLNRAMNELEKTTMFEAEKATSVDPKLLNAAYDTVIRELGLSNP